MTSLLNVFRPLGFLFSFEYRYEKDDMFFQTSVLEAAELTSTELCKKTPTKQMYPETDIQDEKFQPKLLKSGKVIQGWEKKKKNTRCYSQMYLQLQVTSLPAYLIVSLVVTTLLLQPSLKN